MKKFMIALAFASLGTVAANAQSKVYSLNPFWNNWFVQVGVDMSLANPNQAKDWFDNVFPNGKSFGVDLAVGKWFSPQIGLRGKLQWENGIIENKHQNWKDFSIQENPEWVPPYDKERFGLENGLIGGYGMIAGDVMLNLSNIICGYNESRVWNFIPYLGAGVLYAGAHQQWTPALRTGIENTWKLGKRINLFLDVDYTWTTGAFVGGNQEGSVTHVDPATHHGILQTELGVQFNLGKTNWDEAISPAEYERMKAEYEAKIKQYESELAKLRAENADLRSQIQKLKNRIAELEAEVKRLQDELANQPDPYAGGQGTDVVRTVVAGAATSVFFDKNSSVINSDKDVVNLKSIADMANADSSLKIKVTGSADSATGTAEINQRLSEERAAAVKDCLVELGVDASRISTEALGGVATQEPYNLDRRAVVEFAK